jgi:hypothetical protein
MRETTLALLKGLFDGCVDLVWKAILDSEDTGQMG